jgi:glucokinase
LAELGCGKPRSALLGIAGRVDATLVRLTNGPWLVDAAEIGSQLNLSHVTLVNDYVPVAAVLPFLDFDRPDELARIGPSVPAREGVRLALGPGTGLGAAACIPVEDRYWLHPTEAGHVSFGACDGEEFATWPLLERVAGRITAETILSGPGLVRLYRALARCRREDPSWHTPAQVIEAADAEHGGTAFEAVGLFVSLLGRFAGDLALVFGAQGGVYFGSGILPRILDALERRELRRAFEHKAPFQTFVQQVPTSVIMLPEPAIAGLERMALAPDRFLFERHTWSAA